MRSGAGRVSSVPAGPISIPQAVRHWVLWATWAICTAPHGPLARMMQLISEGCRRFTWRRSLRGAGGASEAPGERRLGCSGRRGGAPRKAVRWWEPVHHGRLGARGANRPLLSGPQWFAPIGCRQCRPCGGAFGMAGGAAGVFGQALR